MHTHTHTHTHLFSWGFLGGPVVKTLCFHFRGVWVCSLVREVPHAAKQIYNNKAISWGVYNTFFQGPSWSVVVQREKETNHTSKAPFCYSPPDKQEWLVKFPIAWRQGGWEEGVCHLCHFQTRTSPSAWLRPPKNAAGRWSGQRCSWREKALSWWPWEPGPGREAGRSGRPQAARPLRPLSGGQWRTPSAPRSSEGLGLASGADLSQAAPRRRLYVSVCGSARLGWVLTASSSWPSSLPPGPAVSQALVSGPGSALSPLPQPVNSATPAGLRPPGGGAPRPELKDSGAWQATLSRDGRGGSRWEKVKRRRKIVKRGRKGLEKEGRGNGEKRV